MAECQPAGSGNRCRSLRPDGSGYDAGQPSHPDSFQEQLDKPVSVTIELVYSNDTFRPIKKSHGQPIESYEFAINDPFDRGEIRGGFGYIEFDDQTKNKLIIMTMKDVNKRKPEYASANFWGGKTTVWESGKKVEKEVEGWLDEMVYKTIVREVFSPKHILLDPQKIDDNYQYMKMREAKIAEMEAQADAEAQANGRIIDTAPVKPAALHDANPGIRMPNVDKSTGEVIGVPTGAVDNVERSQDGGPDF